MCMFVCLRVRKGGGVSWGVGWDVEQIKKDMKYVMFMQSGGESKCRGGISCLYKWVVK